MERKKLVWVGVAIGSAVGSYIPALWGADMFSFSSLLLGAVGSIIGIFLGYKFGQ